jgi:outer membrane protein assembly factor BamB
MNGTNFMTKLFLTTFAAWMLGGTASGDWLNFRGSTGAAAVAAPGPSLAVKWDLVLPGRCVGGPIVVGDRVFTTASSGPQQRQLHVVCVAAKTGEKLWERELRATGRTMCHEKTAVAAATPCSDGQRVFALFSSNDLFCFDLEGNLLWLRGLTVDYANASNSLGLAASPIVIGDTLVVPSENDSESFSAGLDVATGRNKWKLDRPRMANWTSPVVLGNAVVLQSGKGLLGVDPATGSRLWEYADGAATMASSAVAGETVYAPSHGLTAVRPSPGKDKPEQLWRGEQLNPETSSPVVLGDKIYVLNNAGVLSQADLATGERGWRLRLTGPFSSSAVAAGRFLYIVSEPGLVQVVDTTAAEGAVAGKVELKDTVLGTPALSDGALFVRSDTKLFRLE